MDAKVGVWIDHAQAVIVSASAGGVTAKTLQSEVGQHPHYAGGGEKNYEARYGQRLDRFFDEVIGQVGHPGALLIFGPGEAKYGLRKRVSDSKGVRRDPDRDRGSRHGTEPQIAAKVKAHYGIAS